MLKQPKIELKNLKYLASLSEETPAYTATIYVNGVAFSEVSNSGHGGGDSYHGLKNKAPNAIWGDIKELDGLIAATFPRHEKYDIAESLECLCHGLVYDEMEKKRFKALLGRNVVMLRAKDFAIVSVKGKKTPQLIETAKKQWPDNIIMNCLAFDEAFQLFKKHG